MPYNIHYSRYGHAIDGQLSRPKLHQAMTTFQRLVDREYKHVEIIEAKTNRTIRKYNFIDEQIKMFSACGTLDAI